VASNEVYGLQLLSALRRNAYLAFPQRRLDKPFVKLQAAWWMLILTCSPDAIRHIMVTHADDYVRLPSGRRVLGPIVGRGLLTSEGELWRRQRRAMAPAFTPRNVSIMVRHIIRSTEMACVHLAQSCSTKWDMLFEFKCCAWKLQEHQRYPSSRRRSAPNCER
jgi:cytochrome P450